MKSNASVLEPRRPGRPSVDRREEILDTAERLYDRLGFEKTTMTDVARELGMSAANLYRSFANRREIDEAIALRKLRVIEDIAWTCARNAPKDAEKALETLILEVMRATRSILFSGEILHRLCVVATAERWPTVDAFVEQLRGALRHVVIEGQRSGRFTPGDADMLAGAMLCALNAVWHPFMIEANGNGDLEANAAGLVMLLTRALVKNNE
ncbi:MAG: TetR/AcrR family transcriptional regulator [Sphingomonas sp.]|uniref:TetR/AcrR family transcriptional regulator n=1 Tax=Sphingomonas sp. TaxID=28214 RepID=UPI0025D02E4F|nr:TetR/AcrR family transcriptional regulator [Sphingomonas sp.]MBX9882557.1 TetR/AcrR family transcriptional regulator [Sphingomonas sp.]